MAKIFITGSADGLGQLAAKELVETGHFVVLHARNKSRAEFALNQVSGAEKILMADLSDFNETVQLAHEVNQLGQFDAVIHNAGVYNASEREILAVNTLAPYILTCLIQKPKRLVYLSSGMHLGGTSDLTIIKKGKVNYSDSKFHDLLLAKTVARKWFGVFSNAVDPGWVPTKMGGAGAPDNLQKGYETQVWLAVDEKAKISGKYFFHQKEAKYQEVTDSESLQDEFLKICSDITGLDLPE